MKRSRLLFASLMTAFAAATLLLAACSSGVKLNEVPVETRVGAPVGGGAGGAGATGASSTAATENRAVAGVQIGAQTAASAGAGGLASANAGARTVYFEFDSYVIKPEFASVVENSARYARANPRAKLMIEGHTDEQGGREYNLALGQRRAEAVRRALVLLGVEDARIEAVSFGKERPAASGGGESAHEKNRRAEVQYR